MVMFALTIRMNNKTHIPFFALPHGFGQRIVLCIGGDLYFP
jgi:hypothetical protein